MLETFHQLRESPFRVNPDPRFLYLSRTHREALSSLLYRIETDSGFLAMVAQPGMGKTTLLFRLLEQLQPKARTALIFHTQCTSSELLRHLLFEFECRTETTDPVRVLQELKSMLVAEASAGRRCVLIVDEAQNLSPEVLETIRLLSNFETPRRKLLNIVLSGQSELGEMLARAELRQLRQRLSCVVHLEKFTPGETARYIAHRLAIAGYSGRLSDLFSADAMAKIANLSEGVPRVINNLCFNALSLGYALGARQIDLDLIEEAALDLGLSEERDADPDDCTAEERGDADTVSELSAAFGEGINGAPTSPEATDTIAETNIEEQSDETYGSEQGYMPAAAAAENRPMKASIARHSSRARHQQREAAIARGLACLLVLLLTPAIDWPANHSVSAHSVERLSNVNSASATDLVIPRHEQADPPIKYAETSHRRYSKRRRHGSLELSGGHRGLPVPVDLGLASFVPEPLLNTLPLAPMPLSAREPRMRAPVSAPDRFDRGQSIARASHYTPTEPVWQSRPAIATPSKTTSHYTPPKPVWQPPPSIPAWYRHPKEDIQLLLSISNRGQVSDVGILSGRGTLAYAAKRAAEMWRYQPAVADGETVSSKVVVTIQFLQH